VLKFISELSRLNMTKLERVTLEVMALNSLDELKVFDRRALQEKLDELTPKIMRLLTDGEIGTSVTEVYDDTAEEYENNPHTRLVIPEILELIDMVPDSSNVLDIGCGHGRDALFLSFPNETYRRAFLKPGLSGPISRKSFNVVAVDGSEKLLNLAKIRVNRLVDPIQPDLPNGGPLFIRNDIHDILRFRQIFGDSSFAGIWSCAALFTHTPEGLLTPIMEGIARLLAKDGVFFTSYTQQGESGRYDKLLLSSTGRIKYFSHPKVDNIAALAAQNGLKLIKSRYSDFEQKDRPIQKNLFVSQFFVK